MAKQISDQEIIETIRTGCKQETLKFLYERCFPKIRALICTNSGNREDALDIFQDAIVILCKQVKENKFDEKYEIDGFLYSVSRNLWINKMKKDNRQVNFGDWDFNDHETTDFTEFIVTRENEQLIKVILKNLGDKCVELLQYSIYHRLSNREICKIMKFTSEDAVKTQKYKCKQKLIAIMKTYPVIRELID